MTAAPHKLDGPVPEEEYTIPLGVSAEVVDPRTLWPLDEESLVESARKTSRVIVIDNATSATAQPQSWRP